jgi:uncharacterized protein YjbJ (UPF0337 family)
MTISQQTLQGNWKEIQGKLKSKWGALTDDDLMEFDGNVEQLMGKIQKKTGAARDSIEQFFDQFSANGASAVSRAGEAVRGYAHQATEAVQETSQQALDSVREGYAEVEDMVRHSPTKSLAYTFGAGLLTGVVLHMMLRWR